MQTAITRRFDGRLLYECDADSMLEALQRAVSAAAKLDRASQPERAFFGRNLIGGRAITRDELRDSESLRRDVRSCPAGVTAAL